MGPSPNQRAVRWLRAELPTLVASGTISAENAQAIERYYEARSTGSSRIGFVLLATVGSILVAAGIVLLIAHNWDDFSRPVRSAIAFLPLIAAQALSIFVLLRRNESKAWRECAAIFNVATIGTAISLVSQTYQIQGSLANFVFVWMLLSIPLVYLLRTTLGAITYLIGAVVWIVAREKVNGFDPIYFWLLLLLVVPYFAMLYRRDRGSGETSGLAIVLAIAAAIGLSFTAEYAKENLGILAFAGFFTATYICGIEFFPAANSGRPPLLALLAGVAIGVMTIALTFEGMWSNRSYSLMSGPELTRQMCIAIELSFPIVAVALAVMSFVRRRVQFSVLAAAFPVVAALGFMASDRSVSAGASSHGSSDLGAAVLLDVYALALGVELIARGLRAESAARTNFGLLVIAALGIARFFDSDLSFVTRAIGFIVIGVGFILTNVVLFKKALRRMNKLRLIIFLVVALAQICVPASMIWKRQRTLREGRLWKFRTAPVDPVDALRGRYLALRFEAEEFPREQPLRYQEKAYVKLKEDPDGFAVIDQVDNTPTEGDDVVEAESFGNYMGKQRLRFAFDRLWVTEANAPAAEKAYAEHSRREKVDAYATVRVHKGDAGIEELYIAGQPLRDYLRAHTP